MRTARWLPILVFLLATLLAPEAFAGSSGICEDWPISTVHHQLALEVRPGQVDAQMQRIRSACAGHPEFACSVISRTDTASSPPEGKLTLRLSGAAVAALSKIAAIDARITAQIMRRQDIEQAIALPDWIEIKSAHRARIDTLLARSDLTDAQTATLKQELIGINLQIANLTAAKEELRPREDSDTLHIEVKAMSILPAFIASALPHASPTDTPFTCLAKPGLGIDALDQIQEILPAAEVQPQLDRISAACAERNDPSCTVIEKGFFTTPSGTLMGRVLMRVTPADVASVTEIATSAAKVTKQNHHTQDHQSQAAQIEARIAMNTENRRRIDKLLSQSSAPMDQTLHLPRELASDEEQLALLHMERAGLRERRTVLIIEMNRPTFSK